VLSISKVGAVYLDYASLFPAVTFNNRTNGLGPALANMLVNLKPSFIRFPGGSWVDGLDLADAYHWELTVGNPADRTERTNVWGYMVSNGPGYEEYLQMCEDLGALPLLCVNCGMSGSEAVSVSDLGPWVQEAVDAIQYATGASNTPWGRNAPPRAILRRLICNTSKSATKTAVPPSTPTMPRFTMRSNRTIRA
jgi:alpha-L-arabinofuranosidase